MRVLICGAGISGLTLAWCLARDGHGVTVIERCNHLRDDGYRIDLFGCGYDASEDIGLLTRLQSIHDPVDRLTFLDIEGHERVSLPYRVLRTRLCRERHLNVMRGDLVRILRDRVNGRCDVRLGTTLTSLERHQRSVVVRLSDGTAEEPDLLVGADGAHSVVRHLAFGPESAFGRFLGYSAIAYVIDDPPLHLHPGPSVVTLTVPNRQVTVYPICEGRIGTFFLYRSRSPHDDLSAEAAGRELRAVYGDLGWRVPELIRHCERSSSVYFDDVEQIQIARWSVGPIVLVGDACQCAPPLAGHGASMAVAGAYVLAEELQGNVDPSVALVKYERRLRPVIERHQRTARRIARWFVPATQLGVCLQRATIRAVGWSSVACVLRHRMAAQRILQA